MPLTKISIGDWVRVTQLWPGFWQVSRVLSGFREPRWSLDDPVKLSKSTLVFCHRLVNDGWKRSFSHQCCELSLVQPLESKQQERLNALLATDSSLRTAFARYKTKHDSIDLVGNVSLGALDERILEEFPKLCDEMLASRIAQGVTLDEVLQVLQERGLEKHIRMNPKQRTLQLGCVNHELRGSDFVFRRYRTLNF